MFGLGWPEFAVIAAIALVIFGPKKIPELGSAFGKTLRNHREGLQETDAEKKPADEDPD